MYYTPPLTSSVLAVSILIRWLRKKADLDLHCFKTPAVNKRLNARCKGNSTTDDLHLQIEMCCLPLAFNVQEIPYLSSDMRFPTMWYVRPVASKGSDQPAHTRSLIRGFTSHLNIL